MPKPVAAVMQTAAKEILRKFDLTLPSQMSSGSLNLGSTAGVSRASSGFSMTSAVKTGPVFARAKNAPPHSATPRVSEQGLPPALFHAFRDGADGLCYAPDREYQISMSEGYSRLIDGLCDGICHAWSTWMDQARLINVSVMGATASGGHVTGPGWGALILERAPKSGNLGWELRCSQAVAQSFERAWQACQSSMSAKSLPWYPSFAVAFRDQTDVSNVPTPISGIMGNAQGLSAASLLNEMQSQFGQPAVLFQREFFHSIAQSFSAPFSLWINATMVANVMASGRRRDSRSSGPQPLTGIAHMTRTGFI